MNVLLTKIHCSFTHTMQMQMNYQKLTTKTNYRNQFQPDNHKTFLLIYIAFVTQRYNDVST